MGRSGISYLDVAQAAHELQEKGLNPTVDRVREVLGTGSKSTIVPHLKHWKSQQPSNIQLGQETTLKPTEASASRGLHRLKELFQCLLETGSELVEIYKTLEKENQALKNETHLLLEKLDASETEKLYLIKQKADIKNELKKLVRGLVAIR